MRNHVINRIIGLAEHDPRIMLLVGDLGFNVVEGFSRKYPDRFVNVGIAEQNMAAVAAGLAISGNIVFTYSIGNFATLRGIEQIRNDICYHHANVKILAVGCGFAYGDLGMTHHATEDIAIMRSLPYMRVYVPADFKEALFCLKEAYETEGPAYIRMARGGEPDLHVHCSEQQLLDGYKIVPGYSDVSILCSGTILSEGYRLRDMLIRKGIRAGVISVPIVKPIDKDMIISISKRSKLIVTMEDHNITGGLGSAVAEIVSGLYRQRSSVLRIGLNETFTEIVGDQDYLRDYYGMTAEKIIPQVLNILSLLRKLED